MGYIIKTVRISVTGSVLRCKVQKSYTLLDVFLCTARIDKAPALPGLYVFRLLLFYRKYYMERHSILT